ncbi:MAG TPA: TonB-dependent receptor [Vicinamibacterales bacterium]|nr:TonB-dependent receptor [Vicinamibacterales bacterium]
MPRWALALLLLVLSVPSFAQGLSVGRVKGRVTDETGGALPGVTVELLGGSQPQEAVTDAEGSYDFSDVPAGTYQLSMRLINFATVNHKDLAVAAGQVVTNDEVMHLSLNAEVVVVGKRTFTNLADVENPAEDLVGIAASASQGAITAKQLDVRPFMRQGEVLETVPGVIITQHSGEGKANQYFLRGFNLDHGSDFAMTVAGTPVNMPTHAHSQGYSDINFLIPELVAGVQYSKGPYYADQGDFATAGAGNINYATTLDRPLVRLETGTYDFGRVLLAASPKVGRGNVLAAFETSTNAGPWTVPDSYRKFNGVLRYSQGDNINGLSLTFMGYHGEWNATEASPQRAIDSGLIDRFGSIDPTDGGHTYRYSVGGEWQRGNGQTLTKIQAYGLGYDLGLISNFTFFLDDPVRGDQREQVDHRFVSGARAFQKRQTRWGGRAVENTIGAQFRNDDVMQNALYHTEARERLETWNDASALVTSAGVYGENQVEWARWLKTTVGLRADGSRYSVTNRIDPRNGGTETAGIVSPKGSATFGPWHSTEFYVNAGTGFHSNSALGTTLKYDGNGDPVSPVTPLVRGRGAEAGVRTVTIPHLQSTVSLWTLHLASELVYNGDLGATEPGPASRRYGVEVANYYSPKPWLIFDGDFSWSRARFTEFNEAGQYVPEAVDVVVSGGASIDNFHRTFASIRLRYFGPRALIEDNSVRSKATSLLNVEGGYQFAKALRLNAQVYNLFDAEVSDIDYYFASRLPGEPLGGIEDIHVHPAVPRTLRVSMVVGF